MSPSSVKPIGSQKPKGGWTPNSFSKANLVKRLGGYFLDSTATPRAVQLKACLESDAAPNPPNPPEPPDLARVDGLWQPKVCSSSWRPWLGAAESMRRTDAEWCTLELTTSELNHACWKTIWNLAPGATSELHHSFQTNGRVILDTSRYQILGHLAAWQVDSKNRAWQSLNTFSEACNMLAIKCKTVHSLLSKIWVAQLMSSLFLYILFEQNRILWRLRGVFIGVDYSSEIRLTAFWM